MCSLHFLESDYFQGTSIRRLYPHAVPTVFPECSSLGSSLSDGLAKTNRPKSRKTIYVDSKEVVDTMEVVDTKEVVDTNEVVETTMIETNKPVIFIKTVKKLPTQSDIQNMQQIITSDCTQAMTEQTPNMPVIVEISSENNVQRLENESINYNERRLQVCNELFRKKLKSQNVKVSQLQKRLEKCEAQRDELKASITKPKAYVQTVEKIWQDASTGNLTALFLKNQIKAYGKERTHWDESIIRQCIRWHARSSVGYNFPRECKLLRLPNQSTLGRFNGFKQGNETNTTLVQKHLHQQDAVLKAQSTYSIIVDEIALET